jgi:hypothetical protein
MASLPRTRPVGSQSQTLFLVWVTLTEHKRIILAECRGTDQVRPQPAAQNWALPDCITDQTAGPSIADSYELCVMKVDALSQIVPSLK